MDTGGETRVAVIIEDDDDIRHLLDTVLTQAGFQVIATSNGQDGIEAVRRYEPVVTTLDVNMPGMLRPQRPLPRQQLPLHRLRLHPHQ
jgi:two-component system OmpR family response regulator